MFDFSFARSRLPEALFAFAAIALIGCKTRTNNQPPDAASTEQVASLIVENGFKLSPSDTSCGGFPKLSIETMPNVCVGMVKSQTQTSFQPRIILEIPDRKNEFLVTDFAGWALKSGKIWYLKTNGTRSGTSLSLALSGLDLPHQIISGPEGNIYFSEDHAIKYFPVSAISANGSVNPASVKTILSGLPPMMRNGKKNSFHPLKHFVFDKQGNIFMNIGAYSDACSSFAGKACQLTDLNIGSSANIKDHGSLIRKYNYKGGLTWDTNYSVVAQGLRNSMGLLFAANGDLLQVENSRDFPESTRPFEELNRIPVNALTSTGNGGSTNPPHYGWPYCYDYRSTSDEWKNYSFKCNATNSNYIPPHILLPPHGAPLGILQYTGSLIPSLTGKLLVPLHGYRPAGHRVLAFSVDSGGIPIRTSGTVSFQEDSPNSASSISRNYPTVEAVANSTAVISGWFESPGIRPKGAPVALTQAQDGSIWMADDKAHAILRIANYSGNVSPVANKIDFGSAYTDIIREFPEADNAYKNLVQKVLKSKQCAGCHDNYTSVTDTKNDGYKELRYMLSFGNWIKMRDPNSPNISNETVLNSSTLYTKMVPAGQSSMPPIDKPFASIFEAEEAIKVVKAFIEFLPNGNFIKKVKNGTTSTIIGTPGSRNCGTLSSGKHVYAINGQPQTLGGKKVLEVKILIGAGAVAKCDGAERFWISEESLESIYK